MISTHWKGRKSTAQQLWNFQWHKRNTRATLPGVWTGQKSCWKPGISAPSSQTAPETITSVYGNLDRVFKEWKYCGVFWLVGLLSCRSFSLLWERKNWITNRNKARNRDSLLDINWLLLLLRKKTLLPWKAQFLLLWEKLNGTVDLAYMSGFEPEP